MKSIRCKLGIHNWHYWLTIKKRTCTRCYKNQRASYDMSYGETIWE